MTDSADDSSIPVEVTSAPINGAVGSDGIVILPTGHGGRYADIALTGLFSAHLANINVGKQLIWQRYYVFFAANSGLLAFVGTDGKTGWGYAVGQLLVGVGMCAVWWVLSDRAWAHNIRFVQLGRRFSWDVRDRAGKRVELNPLADEFYNYIDDWQKVKWKKDGPYIAAMSLILFAGLAHLAAFVIRTLHGNLLW